MVGKGRSRTGRGLTKGSEELPGRHTTDSTNTSIVTGPYWDQLPGCELPSDFLLFSPTLQLGIAQNLSFMENLQELIYRTKGTHLLILTC